LSPPLCFVSALFFLCFGALFDWDLPMGRAFLSRNNEGAPGTGELLARQARYTLVLDMITRTGTGLWPRYGTAPGYEQPGIGADGFQEIFTASMMASLEWGLYDYARGVLDNWLTYFIKDRGFVLYRGLEMAQHGRMLTNIAQYHPRHMIMLVSIYVTDSTESFRGAETTVVMVTQGVHVPGTGITSTRVMALCC
jgi:hypothetical protein